MCLLHFMRCPWGSDLRGLEEDNGPATLGGEGARRPRSEEDQGVLKWSTNEGAGLDSLDAKGSLSALGRVGG
jgi:hypothetical protein